MDKFLWLIPALPLAGFLANAFLRLPKPLAAAVACAGPAGSFILSALAALAIDSQRPSVGQDVFSWITVGGLSIPFGLQVDGLGAVMILVVTGVGSLIHVYSIGYMHEDPGFSRYFAYLNLFMFAMLVLVMADNIVLMFVGWEGVGLCSYLLIGFWYKDLKNADAGKKAFVTNRIGDFGFLLGIFVLWQMFGTLDFAAMKGKGGPAAADLAPWAALFLFLGACGKSAQIPLHVWLPDAMAGPTPVSALIHAATMVTAGVYMVGRMGFLFASVPEVLEIVAVVSALTALMAAVIAVAQTDIKKILAYSTVSQLGFMFAGMSSALFAAGIFHVVTHAFFKALLFLGAGAVIHALHGEQDIRKMGGLARKLPLVAALYGIGALALAGVPPFAGFFSKDLILAAVLHRQGGGVVYWSLVATAALTAFYTTRMVLCVFFLKPGHEHHEVHKPGLAMTAPLVVLALLSLAGGMAPMEHAVEEAVGKVDVKAESFMAMASSIAACAAGILAAAWLFLCRREALKRFVEGPGKGLHGLVSNKFYVDEIYEMLVIRPLRVGATVAWYFVDRILIDTVLVHGAGWLAMALGSVFRRAHTGSVNAGVGAFMAGALAVLAYLFCRFAA